MAHEEAERARTSFGVGEGEFSVQLIGLDGTRVLRSDEPLPADDLIDRMT